MNNIPITYMPNMFSKEEADILFHSLKDKLAWVRRDGAPRSEYYCNDTNVPYTYGHKDYARTYNVQPYSDDILLIREGIENFSDILFKVPKLKEIRYDVCFLNRYHDQSDQLGWHSDNSPEMDDNRPIVIVSFGAEREICFKQIYAPNSDQVKLKLGHGSMCIMHPGMQDTHQHRIPKAGFQCGERISLTYRGFIHD